MSNVVVVSFSRNVIHYDQYAVQHFCFVGLCWTRFCIFVLTDDDYIILVNN